MMSSRVHRRGEPSKPESICKIMNKINRVLVRAAKKRGNAKKPKKGQKVRKATRASVQRHWNTNLLHGRITRSWGKLLSGGRFTVRLRYMCMPLLGDEHLLEPTWEVHMLSIAVEYARACAAAS